jgi:hypothetical protein
VSHIEKSASVAVGRKAGRAVGFGMQVGGQCIGFIGRAMGIINPTRMTSMAFSCRTSPNPVNSMTEYLGKPIQLLEMTLSGVTFVNYYRQYFPLGRL